jgi:Arc/MetJ-type ribon-helix-helix transcriptional regulator
MLMRRPIYNFAIDHDLLDAIRTIKERDGISESEQIRRGLRLWLKSKGVRIEAERKRAVTRKRP